MASEFLVVAERLLWRERRPMSAREIVDVAIRERLFSDNIAGKTPHQTMKAKLSVHIRQQDGNSTFVRVGPGRFYLRRLLDDPRAVFDAGPLRPPPAAEDVLLFPTAWLDGQSRFQGIKTKGAVAWLDRLLRSGVLTYRNRQEAEETDDHKQIVTYVMVARPREVLAYRRGNYNRVEDFLKGAHCIGFGGHVSAADQSLFGYGILEAAARELREELRLPERDRVRLSRLEGLKIVGLLNDDASPTGRRHFAVLLRYDVADPSAWNSPERNEKSITQLHWLNPSASPQQLFAFEYWSQLCLHEFYQRANITRPTYKIRRRGPVRPPRVLVVLGELGSGKSLTTEILQEDFSYTEINSGRVLAELLGIEPVEEASRALFQTEAWEFVRRPNGADRLAAAIWDRILAARSGRVLVDGIRQRSTLDSLRRCGAARGVGVMFVHTPFHIAFQFYRQRAGLATTIADFISLRSAPVEAEVGGLVNEADVVLYNWKGRTEYRRALHSLMRDLDITR